MDEIRCQVTSDTRELHCHHSTPKLFNGADHPSNYMTLARWLHEHLHESANVKDGDLVGKRVMLTRALAKYLLDEDKAEQIHAQIRELDKIMLTQYVDNMLAYVSHHIREQIIRETIITGMNATRDLGIDLMREKAKNTVLQQELEQIKQLLESMEVQKEVPPQTNFDQL